MRLRMDLLINVNDHPAAGLLGYGCVNTGAHLYCRECTADRRVGDPTKPFSFLQAMHAGNIRHTPMPSPVLLVAGQVACRAPPCSTRPFLPAAAGCKDGGRTWKLRTQAGAEAAIAAAAAAPSEKESILRENGIFMHEFPHCALGRK